MTHPYVFRTRSRELALVTLCLLEAEQAVYDSLMESGRGHEDDPDFRPELPQFLPAFQTAVGVFHEGELRTEIHGTDEPTPEELDADDLFLDFARAAGKGAWESRADLDARLEPLVKGYAYERLARVDRNVMRLAAWELENLAYISPAVTLDEWVEIAKRYSTAQSGKFVNGVLGTFLKGSVKRKWHPGDAPADPQGAEFEAIKRRRAPIAEAEVVTEDSEEGKTVRRFGWILKSGDTEIPPNEVE